MGFSTIVAWMGVFMVLVIATFSLITMYTAHIEDMNKIYAYEKEIAEKTRTNFDIESAKYTQGRLDVHAKNTGSTVIKINETIVGRCVEVYIDGVWVNQSLFSTDLLNTSWSPLLWDPDEIMNFSVNQSIKSGPHTVSIVDCGGTKEIYSFTAISPFGLEFYPPTEDTATTIYRNWTKINITIRSNETALDTFKLNWNGTNYTFYDGSLVLALNFNNNSLIGENSTLAVDSSKYANNATCTVNCPVYRSSGMYGWGMSFNGTQNMSVAASDSIATIRTIEFWAYVNSSLSSIGVLDQTNGAIVYIRYQQGVGRYYYALDIGGTTHLNTAYIQSYLNKWTHYAATIDNGMCYLYLNGVNIESDNDCTGPATSANPLIIGFDKDESLTGMNGTLDELRIYNRTLNDSEILMHYQSEFARYNSSEHRFYVNITNVSVGTSTYYGWANNTAGTEEQTDYGDIREIIRAS